MIRVVTMVSVEEKILDLDQKLKKSENDTTLVFIESRSLFFDQTNRLGVGYLNHLFWKRFEILRFLTITGRKEVQLWCPRSVWLDSWAKRKPSLGATRICYFQPYLKHLTFLRSLVGKFNTLSSEGLFHLVPMPKESPWSGQQESIIFGMIETL